MSGRLQRYQTVSRWAQQLEQPCISRSVFTERTGATQALALLIEHRHHMTLSSNVDSRKPHHLTSFLHSVARASEPEFALLLVHTRTPSGPLDTVRALSPGRGRQSSAQGFTFSTAGGDTSPGNLQHLSPSHSLVGSPRSASLARENESWPASADRPGFASRSLNPARRPTTFFPRPPDRLR